MIMLYVLFHLWKKWFSLSPEHCFEKISLIKHISSFSFTLCIYLSSTAVGWFIPQITVEQQLFKETQFFVTHILKHILEENHKYSILTVKLTLPSWNE